MESEQRQKLGECRECAGTVSADATSCPQCGAREPLNQNLVLPCVTPSLMQRLAKPEPEGTTLTTCRDCKQTVSPTAAMCPHCGAPYPAQKKYRAGGEWKSERMVGNRPFIDVAWGKNPQTGKPRVANGVIAIGQFAKGDIAIGQFAYGKYFALGQFAGSFGMAIGQFAVAPLSVGLIAAGVFVVGLISAGVKLLTGGGIDLGGPHPIPGGRHH